MWKRKMEKKSTRLEFGRILTKEKNYIETRNTGNKSKKMMRIPSEKKKKL